jgi:hypothetical protein
LTTPPQHLLLRLTAMAEAPSCLRCDLAPARCFAWPGWRASVARQRCVGLETPVRVADDHLHADQAPGDKVAEKVGPERLGLRSADIQPDDRSPASSCTPRAMTTHLWTTRPPSLTFSTLASSNS